VQQVILLSKEDVAICRPYSLDLSQKHEMFSTLGRVGISINLKNKRRPKRGRKEKNGKRGRKHYIPTVW